MKVLDLQRNLSHQILNPGKVGSVQPGRIQRPQTQKPEAGNRFSDVLESTLQQQDGIKFSAHAMKRLEDRQIELSGSELQRLNEGVQKIEEKGGRNSVILIDDNAYVVSIANKTVVTTLGRDVSSGNVFTNIDSVLIN